MSLAEIESEMSRLSPAELQRLRALVEIALAGGSSPEPAQMLGCTRGLMTFNSGWDDPEPLESWDALREEPSA